MDNILNKYILLGKNIYKIVNSNNEKEEFISLFNEIDNKYIRHKNGIIIEDYKNDSLLFKKDSSFKLLNENNFAKLSCSNEGLTDYYIALYDEKLCIIKYDDAKNKVFNFKILYENDLDYTSLHKLLAIEKKIDRFFELFNLHNPIVNLPNAYGNLRFFQYEGIELLRFFDSVCKKYNLLYWIDYGTLLGAVRHKGYIPWDDDLDVCMMYYDFLKFENIIDNEIGKLNIKYTHNFTPYIYKLESTNPNSKKAWLDIFPFYYLKNDIENNDFINKFREARQQRNIYIKNKDIDSVRKFAIDFNNTYQSNIKTERIFRGFQAADHPLCDLRNYNDVFPLTELEFENLKLLAPKNYLSILNKRYGNFWQYPDTFKAHRSW